MTNISVAKKIIQGYIEAGVKTFCLCPGGRNAPFVEVLSRVEGIETFTFYDERSAGFFAVGRARRDQRPVGVITTSGTAVSELLSSAIEAHYNGTRLVLITADRPKIYRQTGAPQAIEQTNLFGPYVAKSWDVTPADVEQVDYQIEGAVHLNICFDEPLIDEPLPRSFGGLITSPQNIKKSSWPAVEPETFSQELRQFQRPLVVVGGLDSVDQPVVKSFLSSLDCSLYIEGPSGLRDDINLRDKSLCFEPVVRQSLVRGVFDCVIKIGDVPTARFWRDLNGLAVPVFSLNNKSFPGGPNIRHIEGPSTLWSEICSSISFSDGCPLLEGERQRQSRLGDLMVRWPKAEPSWIYHLSTRLNSPEIYIGNSMPIRLWDMMASPVNSMQVLASRGANGIDGQLSCALGFVKNEQTLPILLGDLTTLYDLSAMAMKPQLEAAGLSAHLVVINNQGGKIFSRLYENPSYYNSHEIRFQPLAEAFAWDYQAWLDPQEKILLNKTFGLTEICPDPQETEAFWKEYQRLCSL